MKNPNAVILFTRLPIAGQTKTRLMPFLSAEQCASLHQAMLCDTMQVLRQLEKDIWIFYTPADMPQELRQFQELLGAAKYYPQQGEDLGERMHQALVWVLSQGYDSCLLLGSDIPLLSLAEFSTADVLLAAHDVVLCPTDDGGYWMIGLKQPFAPLFVGQPYGGNSVLQQALQVCRAHHYSVALGPKKRDLDTPEDLYNSYLQIKTTGTFEQTIFGQELLKGRFFGNKPFSSSVC